MTHETHVAVVNTINKLLEIQPGSGHCKASLFCEGVKECADFGKLHDHGEALSEREEFMEADDVGCRWQKNTGY